VTYLLIFTGGLAGSLHCVGMCGGFPLALAAGARERHLLRQLLYNLGRLNTLVFIGALSGAAGAALVAAGPVRTVERALAVAAGTFMVVIGAEMLGLLGRVTSLGAALAQATVGRLLGGVIRSRSLAAPLALGVFNAFLPCQLIYAFAARAASTASVGEGALTMLAFGLGTLPAMLALGVARVLARPSVRARLTVASGLLVVAFGLVTLARGLDLVPHGHHDHPPAREAPAPPHAPHH
jgi:sulfite exporter TauE/SafE